MCGFGIAFQFPNNEILICVSLVILGGAGLPCLPLVNELIVETTFPAGEATSTGICFCLSGPLSGALVALSSLIPYSNQDEYPNSVCRDGELQDLSWFFTITNAITIVCYPFFVYFYRKFDLFSPTLSYFSNIVILNDILKINRNQSCPYLRQKLLRQTMHQSRKKFSMRLHWKTSTITAKKALLFFFANKNIHLQFVPIMGISFPVISVKQCDWSRYFKLKLDLKQPN